MSTLAIKLNVDPKRVRQAVAMITGEVMSDEELISRFFDREDMELDVEEIGEPENLQITAAFVALMIAEQEKEKEKK